MKIYVLTTGENAITVSLNGEAAVAKTVKPTLTALGNGKILFECDGISEEVETYRNIFINAVPLKGSWIAEEDYLSVTLFEAEMNKTFTGGGGSSDLETVLTEGNDAGGLAIENLADPTNDQDAATKKYVDDNAGGLGYLVYNALLSQADEDDPVETVVGTNTIGAIVWTRLDVGQYLGTLSGAFTASKTLAFAQSGGGAGGYHEIKRDTDNTVALFYFSSGGAASDDFSGSSIKIEVHP